MTSYGMGAANERELLLAGEPDRWDLVADRGAPGPDRPQPRCAFQHAIIPADWTVALVRLEDIVR